MENKQRLFIYDRKEMGVLILLSIMVALFAFTLGVHLGKRVGPKGLAASPGEATTAETAGDKLPNRQELTEQGRGASQAADETMNQALHEEIGRTGIKMDTARQVELPTQGKGEKAEAAAPGPAAGAPEAKEQEALEAKRAHINEESIPATNREAPVGKYTLQVGSHPTPEAAKDQVDALEALGLKPFLRAVDLKKKGKWFRVYLGGFGSKEQAEQAGARYQSKNMIDSFIVANMAD